MPTAAYALVDHAAFWTYFGAHDDHIHQAGGGVDALPGQVLLDEGVDFTIVIAGRTPCADAGPFARCLQQGQVVADVEHGLDQPAQEQNEQRQDKRQFDQALASASCADQRILLSG